jgi:DNA-binding transcriptional MerR regulator
VSLTREELAQAVGCSVDEVDRLARFGLLQGRAAGSARVYGSRDLAVARLACRFAAHGLEARHLRSFRLTAEREMGLFAQVVSPLRLRRDPASHHQAAEAIGDLIALAGELHAVLLARLADEELGPR